MVVPAGCSRGDAAAPSPTTPPAGVPGTTLDARVPRALLDVPLVDHRGRPTTLGSLRGEVLVVSDMSTLCQEDCAVGTAALVQAARAVDAAGLAGKVRFLSITVDPERDDRRHVAAYRRLFGGLPTWSTMTGSRTAVDRLWDGLGVWRRRVHVRPPYSRDWLTGRPLTTDVQHTDDLVFIDARQRFRFEIEGPGSVRDPAAVPAGIARFLNDQGRAMVRSPAADSWSSEQVVRVVRWLLRDGG